MRLKFWTLYNTLESVIMENTDEWGFLMLRCSHLINKGSFFKTLRLVNKKSRYILDLFVKNPQFQYGNIAIVLTDLCGVPVSKQMLLSPKINFTTAFELCKLVNDRYWLNRDDIPLQFLIDHFDEVQDHCISLRRTTDISLKYISENIDLFNWDLFSMLGNPTIVNQTTNIRQTINIIPDIKRLQQIVRIVVNLSSNPSLTVERLNKWIEELTIRVSTWYVIRRNRYFLSQGLCFDNALKFYGNGEIPEKIKNIILKSGAVNAYTFNKKSKISDIYMSRYPETIEDPITTCLLRNTNIINEGVVSKFPKEKLELWGQYRGFVVLDFITMDFIRNNPTVRWNMKGLLEKKQWTLSEFTDFCSIFGFTVMESTIRFIKSKHFSTSEIFEINCLTEQEIFDLYLE